MAKKKLPEPAKWGLGIAGLGVLGFVAYKVFGGGRRPPPAPQLGLPPGYGYAQQQLALNAVAQRHGGVGGMGGMGMGMMNGQPIIPLPAESATRTAQAKRMGIGGGTMVVDDATPQGQQQLAYLQGAAMAGIPAAPAPTPDAYRGETFGGEGGGLEGMGGEKF